MATSDLRERYAASGSCQDGRKLSVWLAFLGWLHFCFGGATADVGRRGVKEYRAPEALALIGADREHVPLVCPSCGTRSIRSEEHTSELQSHLNLVCRLLLEKKKKYNLKEVRRICASHRKVSV